VGGGGGCGGCGGGGGGVWVVLGLVVEGVGRLVCVGSLPKT